MNVNSWLAISFEKRFYIGRVKSFGGNGEKLDMEFVQKWREKKFILSAVEMRTSGKLFKLHLPAEKELSRKQQEYCKKFLIAESESDGCDADMPTLSAPTPVKEFSRINKTLANSKVFQT